MKVSAATLLLAQKLTEAASDLPQSSIVTMLQGACKDCMGPGHFCYYQDHIGDGESGDVVFSCDGEMMECPYTISTVNGAQHVDIAAGEAHEVTPVLSYVPLADEQDHYAGMDEAFKTQKLYTALPLYERFIAQSERNRAKDADFAGKGRSFPILSPGDIMAAVRSMGRAGSSNFGPAKLKANIIAIAKKKGWTKYLPKAWRGDDSTSESARAAGQAADSDSASAPFLLSESAVTLDPIILHEARADYEIKLIAPGKGSSAYYPADVLRRDGPKVFKRETHVYLNHQTAAEEAARPEGDVNNLAGVLTTDAVYHDQHAKGPGLYARMKVFSDHAQTVEEKAPHVGMSIRAWGNKESGKLKDGVPVLKELLAAQSVDVVTRAGAGGMILTEAAVPPQIQVQEAGSMTAEEATKLIEAAVEPFRQRAIEADAKEHARALLETVDLKPDAKQHIIARVIERPPVKEGKLDLEAFRATVVKEAQALAKLLGGGNVQGLGTSAPALTEADRARLAEQEQRATTDREKIRVSSVNAFARLMGGSQKLGEAAVKRGEAA